MSRSVLTLAVVLALSAPALADDKRLLARDDIDFARELMREGYADLAADFIKAIQRSGKASAADLANLENDKARFDADVEQDPRKKLELMLKVLKSKEQFAESVKGKPEAERAAAEATEMYREVGELIASIVQKETDPVAAEALAKQGRTLFERLEKSISAQEEAVKDIRDAGDDMEAKEEAYAKAAALGFDLLRTRYFHSKLVTDAGDRERLLKTAIKAMDDFELDYGNELVFYQAFIFVALCHKDLGDINAALKCLDTTINIRTQSGSKDAKGVYQVPDDVADVISAAVLQKMLIQTSTGDQAGAIATAADFIASTPKPFPGGKDGHPGALQGPQILATQGEAYGATGDSAMFESIARKLIAMDPNGWPGLKGRQMLGEGGGKGGGASLGAGELVRIAATMLAKGEGDKAAEFCGRALAAVRAEAKPDAKTGVDACLLLGAIYAQRGWLHEAIVAWEGAVEHFPTAEDAPEALWKAINGWMTLAGQEKRQAYAKIGRERMALLASRYPKHPYAGQAAIVEGRRLEEAGEVIAAVDAYLKIEATSPARPEAVYRAGNALQKEVWRLSNAKDLEGAKKLAPRAEQVLKDARASILAAAGKTLDVAVQGKLKGLAFATRISLANLYLVPALDRAPEVGTALEGAESEVPDNAQATATIWELRFRALQAKGRLDDARKMLDDQFAKDPRSKALIPAALALARALDRLAVELRDANPGDVKAANAWQGAAKYYEIWVNGFLRGDIAPDPSDVEMIATRLVTIGLSLNGVPDSVETFTEWKGELRVPSPLRTAAKGYEQIAASAVNYRSLLLLARTNGFLGEWTAAADGYAKLFEREPVVPPGSKQFDVNLYRTKQELVPAWAEWGVVERESAIAERDNGRLLRAYGIFETLLSSMPKDHKLWWLASYWMCQILYDKAAYNDCDFAVRNIERNSDDFDGGKHGMKDKFLKLKADLKTKVVTK